LHTDSWTDFTIWGDVEITVTIIILRFGSGGGGGGGGSGGGGDFNISPNSKIPPDSSTVYKKYRLLIL